MAPPDGSHNSRIPTLAWDSVVDDGAAPEAPVAPTTTDPAPSASPATPLTPPAAFTEMPASTAEASSLTLPSAPLSAPRSDALLAPSMELAADPSADVSASPVEEALPPIQFAPLTLDAAVQPTPTAAAPAAVAAPAPAPTAESQPLAASVPVAAPAIPVAEPEPVVVASTAPAPIVAPDADPAAVNDGVPQIVEATPVPATSPVDDAPIAPASTGPRLPQAQAAAPAPPQAAVLDMSTAPVASAATARQRKRSRKGLKLVFTLAVLGGVVAAAVVFGQPYLFPGDWDTTTQPYAEAVETVRGVEFTETLAIISEPTADFTIRMSTQLTGDWDADAPVWRALGLLNGASTPASVSQQIAGWQDAIYSTEDGQVYRDSAATGPQADAEITAAMAAAAIDQDDRWSVDQAGRTLDDQALVVAEVQRQSTQVVADSTFAIAGTPVDPSVVAFVPPVVGYRLLAPAVYAEFDSPAAPLPGIGTGGPGPLPAEALIAAPGPTMTDGDTLVSSPQAMDRSFWFLVFGGFLDPRAAYNASESVVESSLSTANRAGAQCAYATFAGGDVAQTAVVRSALETWSAAAPVEFGSTVTVLADGTLQLVSCDPGAGFEHPNRLGVASELIAWRTAELATIEAVAVNDGSAADIEAAWAIVAASDVGDRLAQLPAGTAPPEIAAAARVAVTELFTPVGE